MIDTAHVHLLVDDTANPQKPRLWAEHGLAIVIDAKRKKHTIRILLDTGPVPQLLIHNAGEMNVDFAGINTIVLSHGHYDHVGGLVGIVSLIQPTIPIIAHPTAFREKFAYRPSLKSVGSPFHPATIHTGHGVLLLARNPVPIIEGITTTGEIERNTSYEDVSGFHRLQDDRFIPDPMIDDLSLILNIKGKGLVVVTGCAHSGIINTIQHAQRIMKRDTVYAVIGGFHLKNASQPRIETTTHVLHQLQPKVVAPCHCTGLKAVQHLTSTMQHRCHPLRVGDSLTL